jgi:hypothetical protein
MYGFDIQNWIQNDAQGARPAPDNGNPGGAYNMPRGGPVPPVSRNGQHPALNRYAPPMIQSYAGAPQWMNQGPYSYNLPNHYGEFNYRQSSPYEVGGGNERIYGDPMMEDAMAQRRAMMMQRRGGQGRSGPPPQDLLQRLAQMMHGGGGEAPPVALGQGFSGGGRPVGGPPIAYDQFADAGSAPREGRRPPRGGPRPRRY